ncbi:MAG: OmpA family protein [Verrucomicrobia bacterium]|nr:OmpA family protein [Verrucomicrobiota bacterium]
MSFILASTAIGCKKVPKSITPIPGANRTGPGVPSTTDPTDRGPRHPPNTETTPTTLPNDPTGSTPFGSRIDKGDFWGDKETYKESTVYFAFDSAQVRPEDKSKIDAVAQHLKANPTFKVEVEGHCDERGTEGYNLSLGERRALSVREYLISVGVGGDRVGTITYGESQPAVQGHDETAWAKNRRGEFLLLKPKTQ